MKTLLDSRLQAGRAKLEQSIKQLHELTIRIGHEELAETVSDLRSHIFDPFMFVIVGEVKAGKSSFINALLDTGEEIAKAAPQPMTDVIQQIIYGSQRQEVTINPYLKKLLLPIDILKEIAIVDTPGTNTIVAHHQEITERFIPSSDLIVFVFESKNPYRQSAWEFFDYIHGDWRKKIIFVLQQKDLMPASDLAINYEGVIAHAKQKGIPDPKVFAVSAKLDMEGDKINSGFAELRRYIQQNITGGQAPRLKLINSISTAQTINQRIANGLHTRRKQYEADLQFREEVRQTLHEQQQKSYKQVDLLNENLLLSYDKTTTAKLIELRDGLSFFGLVKRSFSSMFTKTPAAKEWLEEMAASLEKELNAALKTRINEGVVDLADSIQQMARIIDMKIRSSQTILRNDDELFSAIAERREAVLRDLQDQFQQFVNRTENFTDNELLAQRGSISPNLAAGGGIAAIGVILMALNTLTVFDITGGVLTSIGLLFAGFSTHGKRKKIVQGFEQEIGKGRQRLGEELDERLKTYIAQVRSKIEDNFKGFDQLLSKEENTLQQLEAEQSRIGQDLEEIKEGL